MKSKIIKSKWFQECEINQNGESSQWRSQIWPDVQELLTFQSDKQNPEDVGDLLTEEGADRWAQEILAGWQSLRQSRTSTLKRDRLPKRTLSPNRFNSTKKKGLNEVFRNVMRKMGLSKKSSLF